MKNQQFVLSTKEFDSIKDAEQKVQGWYSSVRAKTRKNNLMDEQAISGIINICRTDKQK